MDNIEEFIKSYKDNVYDITRKQLSYNNQDENLISYNLCWIVTDNIQDILGKNIISLKEKITNLDKILTRAMEESLLLIFHQDECDTVGDDRNVDHWFAAIFSDKNVHLVENNKTTSITYETMTYDSFVEWSKGIIEGTIEDRFYKQKTTHCFTVASFTRYPLSEKTINDYLDVEHLYEDIDTEMDLDDNPYATEEEIADFY